MISKLYSSNWLLSSKAPDTIDIVANEVCCRKFSGMKRGGWSTGSELGRSRAKHAKRRGRKYANGYSPAFAYFLSSLRPCSSTST
jgi:hypothetical protein